MFKSTRDPGSGAGPVFTSLSQFKKPLDFSGLISFSVKQKIQLVIPMGPLFPNILRLSDPVCAWVWSLLSEHKLYVGKGHSENSSPTSPRSAGPEGKEPSTAENNREIGCRLGLRLKFRVQCQHCLAIWLWASPSLPWASVCSLVKWREAQLLKSCESLGKATSCAHSWHMTSWKASTQCASCSISKCCSDSELLKCLCSYECWQCWGCSWNQF